MSVVRAHPLIIDSGGGLVQASCHEWLDDPQHKVNQHLALFLTKNLYIQLKGLSTLSYIKPVPYLILHGMKEEIFEHIFGQLGLQLIEKFAEDFPDSDLVRFWEGKSYPILKIHQALGEMYFNV